jgi:Glycosyl hydrolases family 31/Galactose mutarotase-like
MPTVVVLGLCWLQLLLLLLGGNNCRCRRCPTIGFLSTVVMAVDRSKFRTCEQTGFCRTHRPPQPQPHDEDGTASSSSSSSKKDTTILYRLEHVEFHPLGMMIGSDPAGTTKSSSSKKPKSLWNSFLSSSSSTSTKQPEPPVGPVPYTRLTGSLVSMTIGQDHQEENGANDGSSSLEWAIAVLPDATLRMRIIDPMQHRPTYDTLVLEPDIVMGTTGSTTGSTVPPLPNVTFWDESTVSRILQQRGILLLPKEEEEEKDAVIPRSVALEFGGTTAVQNNNTTTTTTKPLFMLWIQLSPFYMILYDEHSNKMAAAGKRLYFDRSTTTTHRATTTAVTKDKERPPSSIPTTEPTTTADKEIVGYWEDGLAIYADGTREEHPPPPVASTTTTTSEEQQEQDEEQDQDAEHGPATTTATARRLQQQQQQQESGYDDYYHGEPESFGGHTDARPNGPQSVGMQLEHYHTRHLYGIPEHASSTTLHSTTVSSQQQQKRKNDGDTGPHYQEPYRLYNLDVFEYELDEPMALYGSIPLLISHSNKGTTMGFFWFNPTETFVDVALSTDKDTTDETNDDNNNDNDSPPSETFWMSESGIIDLFFLTGPTPQTMYQQYRKLTGATPLPPMFSLGYHQCRWNYKNQADVDQVHEHFEMYDYPYDVLWLDIEHTDGKRYFTWDKNEFPNPKEMQLKLARQGRRMVTIIDPHIGLLHSQRSYRQGTLYQKRRWQNGF